MPLPEFRTGRLLLRGWRDADLAPFVEMNRDPEVMRHFPGLLTPEESAQLVTRNGAHIAAHGFGLWALELPGEAPFIGFTGLAVRRFEAAFTPCVEIGWRLARICWGRGLATEAARAILDFAFGRAGLSEVVSFTVPGNLRSRAVMERLGMRRSEEDDFDHPLIPKGHPLRRHVLYRLRASHHPP